VSVDGRIAGRVAMVVGFVTVATVAVLLLVAGLQKNAQIDSLRAHGVPVEATVTGCVGLLGGSGSNGAGYACSASYTFDGRQYHENLPGSDNVATGSTVQAIVASDDPALFSTPSALATQHASARVFLVPAVLFGALVGIVMLVAVRRRRARLQR
jgi:hypothetical protein